MCNTSVGPYLKMVRFTPSTYQNVLQRPSIAPLLTLKGQRRKNAEILFYRNSAAKTKLYNCWWHSADSAEQKKTYKHLPKQAVGATYFW